MFHIFQNIIHLRIAMEKSMAIVLSFCIDSIDIKMYNINTNENIEWS